MGWEYSRNVTAILAAWALQKVLGNYRDSEGRIQSDMVEMCMVDQNMMILMPRNQVCRHAMISGMSSRRCKPD